MSHPHHDSTAPVAAPASLPPVPPAEIDAGCRLPLWGLFGGAAFWLVVGSILAVIASIKMHGPGFLANVEWLTYGRVRPAASQVFLYGFAFQAAMGMALWLLARLGRTPVVGPVVILIAAKVWNIGVLIGLGGILVGGATGFDRIEFPGYALGILLISLVVMVLCAFLTFQNRRVQELYPSQWYLIGALLWFPWLLSTAWLLLMVWPVRGVAQMAIQSWYANGHLQLWLVPVGVAALLYFIPLIAGRPLFSRYYAMFAFWTQALFAGWCGLHNGAPLPAWMVGMSVVCGVLLVLPVLSTVLNLHYTLCAHRANVGQSPAWPFFVVGVVCFLASGLLGVLNAIPSVSRVLQFSLFGLGLEQLALQGFFASVAFGVIYHVSPLVAGIAWPCAAWIGRHFWLHVIGMGLASVALLVGGFVQGAAWNNPNLGVVDVARKTLPFAGMATLGNLLVLAGSVCLFVSFNRLALARCRVCFQPWIAAISAPVAVPGVKA